MFIPHKAVRKNMLIYFLMNCRWTGTMKFMS